MAWNAASSCDASIVETCDGELNYNFGPGDICEGQSVTETLACVAVNENPACNGAGEGSYNKTVTTVGTKKCCSCPDVTCNQWQAPFETRKTCPDGRTINCTTCLTVRDGAPTPTITPTRTPKPSSSNPSNSHTKATHTKATPTPSPSFRTPNPTLTLPPFTRTPTQNPITTHIPNIQELLDEIIHPGLSLGPTLAIKSGGTTPKATPKPATRIINSIGNAANSAGTVVRTVIDKATAAAAPFSALGLAALHAAGYTDEAISRMGPARAIAAMAGRVGYSIDPNHGCAFGISQVLTNIKADPRLSKFSGSASVIDVRKFLESEIGPGKGIAYVVDTDDAEALARFENSNQVGYISTKDHSNEQPNPWSEKSHVGLVIGDGRGTIYSNSSQIGTIQQNYTIKSWNSREIIQKGPKKGKGASQGPSLIYVPVRQID